ncbi:MAG: dihydrolipoamide acetyltransferase family protein, partial [Syntrophobacteraceae bacterium]
PVAAAPSTRRLARELGVDLRLVTPSGPGGRVTPEDVRAFAEGAKKPAPPPPKPAPKEEQVEKAEAEAAEAPALEAAPPLPRFDRVGPVERIPLRSVRRATAKHVALSWSQIPHVSHMDTADITELEEFRRKHRKQVEDQGGALSLTVFVLKAAAFALKKFPRFNASLDMDAEEIILKHYYNIAVAVDTDRGLLVPVIRDVDCKSLMDLGIELKRLAEKTRQGKTSVEELSGGTFTITNIGPLGGASFNPIINYPQAAILGMAQARLQPVVIGDERGNEIVPRLILPLIITFDHRLLDGAEAARFLTSIIEALENPENLMMVM